MSERVCVFIVAADSSFVVLSFKESRIYTQFPICISNVIAAANALKKLISVYLSVCIRMCARTCDFDVTSVYTFCLTKNYISHYV